MDNLNTIQSGFLSKRNNLRQRMDQRRSAIGDRLSNIMATRPQAPMAPVAPINRPQPPAQPQQTRSFNVQPRPEVPPMNLGELRPPMNTQAPPPLGLNNMRGTDIVNAILKLRRQNATFRG